MTRSSLSCLAGAFAGAALILSTTGAVIAAPTSVAGAIIVSSPSGLVNVRAQVHARRRGNAIPGAVLGLFGAALGAAVASQRYDNYSYYSYGYPNGYGYAPAYGGVPYYGGGQRGFGGPRGGFGGGRMGGGGGGRAHVAGHVGHR